MTIWLPPVLARALKARAHAEGRPGSIVLADAIRAYLGTETQATREVREASGNGHRRAR